MNFDGRIFLENASGFAAASLGQIVEGYAVVFGQENKINLKSVEGSDQKEFLHLVLVARRRTEERYGPTVIFEHGASCAGTNVSCGVNRIHVHIVPYHGGLLKNELEKTFKCVATVSTTEQLVEELHGWDIEKPYFWLQENDRTFLFSYGEKRESQVVRRALARLVGAEEKWNWREYPTQEVAERVAKELLSKKVLRPAKTLYAEVA